MNNKIMENKSNYTVPTSKLTATTNTKILTCQSNRFVDNSTLNNTFLISGNPAVTAFGPFLTSAVYAPTTGASAYFNASSAILVASPPSFGPQSWTFECWFYFTGDGTYRVLLAQGPANGTDVSEFYRSSDNKLTFDIKQVADNLEILAEMKNISWLNSIDCSIDVTTLKKAKSEKKSAYMVVGEPNFFQKWVDFFKEVKVELKKVTWPTQKQTTGTTIVVIIFVFVVAAFLGLFDLSLSKLVKRINLVINDGKNSHSIIPKPTTEDPTGRKTISQLLLLLFVRKIA